MLILTNAFVLTDNSLWEVIEISSSSALLVFVLFDVETVIGSVGGMAAGQVSWFSMAMAVD